MKHLQTDRKLAGGIVLRRAAFAHPGHTILGGVDLDIPLGGTCVITGNNGCGKSTLLQICAGLLEVQAGSVAIGGRRVGHDRPSDFMRRGIRRGFLFQEGGLLSNMNSVSNVALALRYHADLLGLSQKEVDKRAVQALDRLQISEADKYALPAHLSYGERKRVALARAIAIDPNFFYFDDPDVGLDRRTLRLVEEILLEYRDRTDVTTVVATNREELVSRMGSVRYVLARGHLFEQSADHPPPTMR
jgi:ABC-type transporter Mla maintaining outer membrane lipid asymmetry ATPase subunit MlaF